MALSNDLAYFLPCTRGTQRFWWHASFTKRRPFTWWRMLLAHSPSLVWTY